MQMVALPASAREDIKPNALRRKGKVPCIVYGHDVKSMAIQVDRNTLHKAFQKAGESTLVELDVDGKKMPVLFKDVIFHPVSSQELHVDFYAVNMKEEIETKVPLVFTGESPAVKDLAAVFVTAYNEVTVRCLPSDLPSELPVDIAALANIGDTITIKDIALPKGVAILEDADAVIATVQEQRKEEVVEPVVAEGAVEGAPAAEGAPGAEAAAPEAGAKK
jgi:large subunit ribosomal protein L25